MSLLVSLLPIRVTVVDRELKLTNQSWILVLPLSCLLLVAKVKKKQPVYLRF